MIFTIAAAFSSCAEIVRKSERVIAMTRDAGTRLYPVGRLDMDSEGLVILTDDGAAANALMHPRHAVDKLYTVFVQGADIKSSIHKMQQMTELEGERICAPQVMLVELKGNSAELQITIHEGKNRQIRRMCRAVDMSVIRLIRIAEGPVTLGELPSGKWRAMTKDEISFLQDLT